MHVPDELLRDRARAAAMIAGDPLEDLALDGAGDADQVDAVVLVEALVLDGDERLADVLRQRANRDARARLAPDLADERPVAREDERRLRLGNDLPGYRPGATVAAVAGACAPRDGDGDERRATAGRATRRHSAKSSATDVRIERRGSQESGGRWPWEVTAYASTPSLTPPTRPLEPARWRRRCRRTPRPGDRSLMAPFVTLALAQFQPRKGDYAGNLARIGDAARAGRRRSSRGRSSSASPRRR